MVKTIHLDIYDAVIGLILPGAKKPDVKKWYIKTWPQYKKHYKPLEKELDFKQEYYKGCFLSNGEIYMIHIPQYDDVVSLYSTVSHECLHATNRILKDKHIPQKESTEECYAYVQGYLTSVVLDHILNNTK